LLQVLLKPRPPPTLDHFGASFLSQRGLIQTAWKWVGPAVCASEAISTAGRIFTFNATVPPNVRAYLVLPSRDGVILECDAGAGTKSCRSLPASFDAAMSLGHLEVGSGTYQFVTTVDCARAETAPMPDLTTGGLR